MSHSHKNEQRTTKKYPYKCEMKIMKSFHDPSQVDALSACRCFCSILLRAAKIMSSLRSCNKRCRSSLLCDHPLVDFCDDRSLVASALPLIFELRLYREIRSWPSVLREAPDVDEGCAAAGAAVVEGRTIVGWNEGGGYTHHLISISRFNRNRNGSAGRIACIPPVIDI